MPDETTQPATRSAPGDATIVVTCEHCRTVTNFKARAITKLVADREYQFWCPACGPVRNPMSPDVAALLGMGRTPYIPGGQPVDDPDYVTCEVIHGLPSVVNVRDGGTR
jgi:hypothetical protein